MPNPRKFLKNRTVLVTGGAGFIGSHLCDHLMNYGARVVCFDDLSTGSKNYVDSQRGNKKFFFIKGDVNKLTDIKKPFAKFRIDYVFHYAALVGVQRTIEEPLKVLADLDGIRYILDLSYKNKVKKLVFASSSEVYGNQEQMPLHEEESYLDIRMPYAMVKSAGENYFRTYWEMMGLPVTILRFFNVYGPRQESSRYGFVVGVFISQVLRDQQPTIFYDGKQTRDFMYIDDNVEAAIGSLLNKKTDGETINLGTGRETTILELAQKIIALSGKKLAPSLLHKRNLVEIKRRVAHNDKMINLLGYKLRVSLEDGLRLTHDWYAQNPQFVKDREHSSYSSYRKQNWIPKTKLV